MPETTPRDTFTTRWGFILASAGAAVGLGNLWMFPWRMGEYGGAAFLLPYLFFVYVLGTTGLMGEFAFGRWAGKGAVGAFDKALRERGLRFGRALGAFPVLTLLGVLIFYSIVTGWVLRYVASSVTGTFLREGSVEAYFHRFAGQPGAVPWQLLAVVLTGGILVFGVSRGIERASKVLMPLMAVLLVILLVRAVTLPGAAGGIRYVLVPDWSYLLKPISGQQAATISESDLAAIHPRVIGPAVTGGRVTDVDVDPSDPSTVYVATPSGELWKSTNRIHSWTNVFAEPVA